MTPQELVSDPAIANAINSLRSNGIPALLVVAVQVEPQKVGLSLVSTDDSFIMNLDLLENAINVLKNKARQDHAKNRQSGIIAAPASLLDGNRIRSPNGDR